MTIHVCRRCEGSGHVVGGFQWEVPWTWWAASEEAAQTSFLEPHACPDCGGTGALIEFSVTPAANALPTRRGLRDENPYASHVSRLLHSQRRPRVN